MSLLTPPPPPPPPPPTVLHHGPHCCHIYHICILYHQHHHRCIHNCHLPDPPPPHHHLGLESIYHPLYICPLHLNPPPRLDIMCWHSILNCDISLARSHDGVQPNISPLLLLYGTKQNNSFFLGIKYLL